MPTIVGIAIGPPKITMLTSKCHHDTVSMHYVFIGP